MFKDYYSILRISYPSSDEEIKNAHTTIVNDLGVESTDPISPNYQVRVDTEEAYRVLGTSYILKMAYDKEYQKAMTEGFDIYEIEDDWLLSGIERERNIVFDMIVHSDKKNSGTVKKKNKVIGCLVKVFLFHVALVSFIHIKKCSRERVRESYESSVIINPSESTESRLRRLVIEKNACLPQDMDENITIEKVLLECDALVYVYKVDDIFFLKFKEYAMSRELQLKNLENVCYQMKPIVDLLVETHRGIYYRYICRKSGESVEFKIYYSDLLILSH